MTQSYLEARNVFKLMAIDMQCNRLNSSIIERHLFFYFKIVSSFKKYQDLRDMRYLHYAQWKIHVHLFRH